MLYQKLMEYIRPLVVGALKPVYSIHRGCSHCCSRKHIHRARANYSFQSSLKSEFNKMDHYRKTMFAFVCFACVWLQGIAMSIPAKSDSEPKSFACEYYSDGTNVCYTDYRSATSEDNENPKRLQGFGIVALSDPINGTWTGDEALNLSATVGFFTSSFIDKTIPKKFIGACTFGVAWSCTGAPRFWTDERGNQVGVGGGLFQGNFYSGQPGGTIRATAMPAGFLKSST